ncbi:hypothetical protein N7474_008538 [Penicillium riverlandense]|uniref:uncharacterized protein n=1 Tax=Penicillium riverlandense TaxID=1903569 RepID=UPI0025479585|nr:uncharacterized protein N7474_008538 [Penicillium riverlandense]KAJ5812237.1 hypothetical protein N7474_008538 [Penicillium riverlandense]
MTHKVDLGRSLFCTIDSRLRLHLAASAQFRLPPTHRRSDIPFDMSQWLASEDVWVLPGPQLEFSCRISADPVLEGAISGLSSLLRDKLCRSKIWPSLGYTAMLKDCTSVTNLDMSRDQCLVFGLCKQDEASPLRKRWTLPDAIQNPVDVYPPTGVRTVFLTSVDIVLDYSYCAEHSPRQEWQYTFAAGGQPQLYSLIPAPSFQYRYHPDTNSPFEPQRPSISGYIMESPLSSQSSHSSFSQTSRCPRTDYTTIRISQELLRLFDFGLQRLILSGSIKDPQVLMPGQETLHTLSDIAPAVFSRGYREVSIFLSVQHTPQYLTVEQAINQRAASLTTLTKALSSMLEGSRNRAIQNTLSTLLRTTSNPDEKIVPTQSNISDLKPAISTSLWRIAQQNLHKTPKTRKLTPFFDMDPGLEVKLATEEPEDLPLFEQEEMLLENRVSEPYYLEDTDATEYEGDEVDAGFSELLEKDIFKKPDDLLLEETRSESSFVDIGESTQSTFPDTGSPCSLLFIDHEMLLSNDGAARQEGIVPLLDQQDEVQDFEGCQMLCE